jgi:hypothetical protein
MRKDTKREDEHSPVAILTELAIEGTSSVVEAHRTLLNLVQQENNIILNGFKEQVSGFLPLVAMTDLVRRSLDTLIGMQQELLTITNKQALRWFEQGKAGKIDFSAHAFDFAREEVDAFVHAHKQLLDVLSEETAKATSGKRDQHAKHAKKTEWSKVLRDAADAFLDAQKRLLDVLGQQMNVNLDAATHAGNFLSPSRFLPVATIAGERVKNFVDAETSLVGSIFKPKALKNGKRHGSHKAHHAA